MNKMTGISIYFSIITLNINGLNYPMKNTDWQVGLKNKNQLYVAYKKYTALEMTNAGLR
jgi:hypothetical protein